MAVIKSVEKTYTLKIVVIPEYYLGGNVESLGEAWKNQGLELDLSTIPTFKTSFLNLKIFLARILGPSSHS
jgi:hypothetical protein